VTSNEQRTTNSGNPQSAIPNPWPRPDLQAQQPVPITSRQGGPQSPIRHHICTTAFGYTAILFQTEPLLLKRIFLPHSHKRALKKQIEMTTGPAKPGHTPAVLNMCKDIQAYFNGASIKAPWKSLDLSGLTPLQRSVLKAVSSVPYGEVRSYGQVAAQIGHPRACRFVGTTLARNPFPILIPCHRILRADGSPGGFYGGTDLKKRMLLLERPKSMSRKRVVA
jgi:methylated-DNA-[protein]-cysteine S-methyltransferase